MPLVLLALLILLTGSAYAKQAAPDTASHIQSTKASYTSFKVERVIDGDTLVASGTKIRLWGINAPEKNEPLFDFSKNFLDEYLKNKYISCKLIDFDKYKRQVMHCYADDIDLGAVLVMLGLAKDYPKYSGGFYSAEEISSKRKKLGIWASQ